MNSRCRLAGADGDSRVSDYDDAAIQAAVARVAAVLQERGWLLSTAESCTGGWIAKSCTDLAGSSAWFDRGYVAYSYPAKEEELGVIPADLEAHGAVSEEIAGQMALGARQRSGSQVTLAATGIAGPGGGMANKPVGMVCLAWSVRGGLLTATTCHFEGDREAVRRQTVIRALDGVLHVLGD